MIYPWHRQHWQSLFAAADRLPHALLLCGPEGGGKRAFAEALAQRLLCEQPGADGQACGSCESCRWFARGTHPDVRRVEPESEVEEAAAEADEDAEPGRKKKASRQILIDRVRALNDFVMVGTHRHGMRVILIDPAEAMNVHTANALLKLLEEPTMSTLFLLVSHAPRRLLATVRSRCRTVVLGKPEAAEALDWLRSRDAAADAAALALAGGMPLAALQLAGAEGTSYRRQFEATVGALDGGDPLQAAAQWEGWLRQKDGAGALRLPVLVAWLQKWVYDLALWKSAGRARFFPGAAAAIERLAGRAQMRELLACYNELSRMRSIAEHPLNPRLFLEDMAIRYARMLGSRGIADG
jgi:DNA polymerase-3 subunit delta'